MDDEISPGFRFDPTQEELVSFYLQLRLQGKKLNLIDRIIPVLYIYDYNPWDLPQLSGEVCRKDPQLQEWFFFISRQARGGRPNRLTTAGYWKATGSPGWVYSSKNELIGVKRTMVFYQGRARTRSEGSKTEWKMNEYEAVDPANTPSSSSTPAPTHYGEFTLCRVYTKAKCLRAFDRRPTAPPMPMHRHSLATQGDHHQPSSSDHQYQPQLTVQRRSSSESLSSSGDLANNEVDASQGKDVLEDLMNMDLVDQIPLWEWDSFMSNWNL